MAADTDFAASIADLYDEVLGPFMFEPFAREAAAGFAGFSGQVLEVAAGTGILTRELDRVLGPGSSITATDLNPPMLERAEARLQSSRVSWMQADALALPFRDESFDAVFCQFGVMFYPDQAAGHREARRVLKEGGRYFLGVWDDLASNEVAEVVHQAVGARFPDDPPRFLARTPHGHHEIARLCANLAAAGFDDVSSRTVMLRAGRETAERLASGYCEGTPLRHEILQRAPDGLTDVVGSVADALRERFGGEAIDSAIQAHLITAVR